MKRAIQETFEQGFNIKRTLVIISVIKHVTWKWSDDWSTDAPLYTSQLDMIVASRLDTKGLHLDRDDTPEQTDIQPFICS